MAFSLLQIIYWIALAPWFGGVLFIAIAAPIIFKTVKENNPILPMVLSVNLEGQHGSLLAGTIVANLISHLKWIESICAGGLLVGLIGQWRLSETSGDAWLLPMVRSGMFVAALGFMLFDWRLIWPKITLFRDQYIAHADEPDVANPANDEFNRYQRESELLLRIRLALLLGMILFSSNITPKRIEIPLTGGRARSAVIYAAHFGRITAETQSTRRKCEEKHKELEESAGGLGSGPPSFSLLFSVFSASPR